MAQGLEQCNKWWPRLLARERTTMMSGCDRAEKYNRVEAALDVAGHRIEQRTTWRHGLKVGEVAGSRSRLGSSEGGRGMAGGMVDLVRCRIRAEQTAEFVVLSSA